MSLIPGERPLAYAPSLERRQFVPWLTSVEVDVLGEIDFGLEVMLIAHPLADAATRPALARRVRRQLKVGLLLEPEVYLLQLDAERRAQPDVAGRIGLLLEGRDQRHLDLEAPQRAQTLQSFVRHVLDTEIAGLASALVAPSPLLRNRSVTALDNASAMLRAAATYFVTEELESPADDSVPFHPRQLFAAITLDVRTLRDDRFMELVLEAFAAAPPQVYGYLVQVAGLGSHPQTRDARSLADFLYALQALSERPVVVARVGSLGVGFLAGGLAGYAVGPGVSELLSFPPRPFTPPEAASKDKRRGFSIVAFHQILLRNVRTLGPNSAAGRKAFHRLPCECGYHDAAKPPHTNQQRKLHSLWWRCIQARQAVGGGAGWLLRIVAVAEAESAQIDGETAFYAALRETLPGDYAASRISGEP
jgi:hypothetical protein